MRAQHQQSYIPQKAVLTERQEPGGREPSGREPGGRAGGTHRKTRTRWKGRRYSQKDKNPVEGQEARALVSPSVDFRVRVKVSEDVVNVGPYPLQGKARITHQIKTRWVVFPTRDSQTMTVSVRDSQIMTVSVRDSQTCLSL